MLLNSLLVFPSSRVGIVVYPGVPGEFIGSAEAFGTSRKLAGMWFFASVGSDMASLML
jgi:hypothetical protein